MVTALLTDLGTRDPYVAAMKGVILTIAPDTRLVDLSHDVARHNVREAAYDLFVSYRYFPPQTIFCCVVDPGVGSDRRAVALELGDDSVGPYYLIGPDNGLFTGTVAGMTVHRAVSLEAPEYQLPNVSRTFHGRDIFAPAAAHVAAGVDLAELGPAVAPETLVSLPWATPRPQEGGGWEAGIIHTDRFGNLITNMHSSRLEPDLSSWHVWLGEVDIGPVRRTFADVRPGRPLAYVGSSGFLELAVRDDSAEHLLNVGPDSVISVAPTAQ